MSQKSDRDRGDSGTHPERTPAESFMALCRACDEFAWYEYVATSIGDERLRQFGDEDWAELKALLPSAPVPVLERIVCCLRDGANPHHAEILRDLILSGSDDVMAVAIRPLVTCDFDFPEETVTWIVEGILRLSPEANTLDRMTFMDVLSRLRPKLPEDMLRRIDGQLPELREAGA